MTRVIASRRKLPARPPLRVVSAWWLVVVPASIAAVCWLCGFALPAVIFAAFTAAMVLAIFGGRSELRRDQRLAAERSGESACSFARSFDFRHTDTAVIRAVYEEVQANVAFPIRATDRLRDDLRLDDEDLGFDIIPAIARRIGRTLDDYKANPNYEDCVTVAGLVHFLAAQPYERAKKT